MNAKVEVGEVEEAQALKERKEAAKAKRRKTFGISKGEYNKRMKEGGKILDERRRWLHALANSDIDDASYDKEVVGMCSDCFAKPGEEHAFGCDHEHCADCGGQFISCPCMFTAETRLPHDPVWHGYRECREFGWTFNYKYVRGEDGKVNEVECDKNDPEAAADVNRLYGNEAVWSKDQRRFVLRENATPEEIKQQEEIHAKY